MGRKIDIKSRAIESIGIFTNRPDLYDNDQVEKVLKRASSLAFDAVTAVQKRALSYESRYTKGKRGQRQDVIDEWNADSAIRYLGPAPKKKSGYRQVHRRLRKLADRIRSASFTVRPSSGNGSGSCSGSNQKTAYVGKLTGGGNVNICPKFFVAGRATDRSPAEQSEGDARQAGILIHELCHSLGVFGKKHKKKDSGTNEEMLREMRAWADGNGKKARGNPDSYEAMIAYILLNELR